jgi:hypothetical protein
MNKQFKIISILITLSLTALAFQNCGEDFNPDEYVISESQGLPTIEPIPPSSLPITVTLPPAAPAAAPVITGITPKQVLPFYSTTPVPLSVAATGTGLTYTWYLLAPDINNPSIINTTQLAATTSQIMTTSTTYVVNGVTYSYVNVGTYRVRVTNSTGEFVTGDIVVEFEPFQFDPNFPAF